MTEETPTPAEQPAEAPVPQEPSGAESAEASAKADGPAPESEKQHVFDDPENVKKLLKIFFICCVALLPAQFLVEMHGHFKWEGWFGFYAFYGLVSCIVLVLISKFVLRPLVMRDEHFYDDPAPEAGDEPEAGSHA